jgi:hypothetical protein
MTGCLGQQDYSIDIDNLGHLSKAIELKSQGKLIHYNITAQGLEEKGLCGKIFAKLANALGLLTNTDVFEKAKSQFFDQNNFKQRFCPNTDNDVSKTVDGLAQMLLKPNRHRNRPLSSFQQLILNRLELRQVFKLQLEAFQSLSDELKETVFQGLNPETQKILLSQNPDNFNYVADEFRNEVFQGLNPETQKILLSQNPDNFNYVADEFRNEVFENQSSETKEQIFSNFQPPIKNVPEGADIMPANLEPIADSDAESMELTSDLNQPRMSEEIFIVKLDKGTDIEVPFQSYKDVIQRLADFSRTIKFGEKIYTLDANKDGEKLTLEKTFNFIKETKDWVESEFKNLNPLQRQAIFMSILQNLTQGIYQREQEISGSRDLSESRRNYRDNYNVSAFGFSQRFSIEIEFKKQADDKLELSGKTVAKFFTPDETNVTKHQFYEGTCTFKRELSKFDPILNVSNSQKSFRNAWLETEQQADVSVITSKTYLPEVKEKIDEELG